MATTSSQARPNPHPLSSSMQDETLVLDDGIFADKKSGKQFRIFKYFDHEVIQDVETGWINAGKFVQDIGRIKGKKLCLNHFKQTEDFKLCIEFLANMGPTEIRGTLDDEISYKLSSGYGNDVKGSYVPFEVFQLIALWADKKHKMEVLKLLRTINETANLINRSAYDVLNNINDQLKEENAKLKQEIYNLEDTVLEQTLDREFLSFDNSKLQAQVQDLNTPINQSIQPSSIYASPVGDSHFQLRYSKETISDSSKIKNLKHIELINAKDVLDLTRKTLKKSNETSKLNGKVVLPTSKLDQTFDLISSVKQGNVKLPTQEEINNSIDEAINSMKLKRLTPQVKGKIFELEQLKQGNYMPWSLIPKSLLERTNEQSRDCGIDGLKLNENSIEEIVQIKYHNKPSYLNINEVKTFMNKCNQARYKNIKKKLILHGCKLGKQLRAKMNKLGINIEIKE